MRGKDLMPTNFYEDENLLAYASINAEDNVHPMTDLTFDIEVLNKKSEEITPIQLEVPKGKITGWMMSGCPSKRKQIKGNYT